MLQAEEGRPCSALSLDINTASGGSSDQDVCTAFCGNKSHARGFRPLLLQGHGLRQDPQRQDWQTSLWPGAAQVTNIGPFRPTLLFWFHLSS